MLPEDIRLPANVAELDLIMGRPYTRTLTHKGIELDGLFYHSPELQELRCRGGTRLIVDVRLDENDMGHIFVIPPDSSRAFRVPALNLEYAKGISRWQHGVFRRRARDTERENNSVGWLEAQQEIAQLIEQDFMIRRKTSRKRVGRYIEDTQHDGTRGETIGNSLPLRRASEIMPAAEPPRTPPVANDSDSTPEFRYRPVAEKRFRTTFQERNPYG